MHSMHQVCFQDARYMQGLENDTIDLVVTSPPYPMIEMWDTLFCEADPEIAQAMARNDGTMAFRKMHGVLNEIWREILRVLKPGGMACINIGDATRNLNGAFRLYANHTAIVAALEKLGLVQLPAILWRKPTNAPTKFMGSGMLPPSAYVTLEHEYILIFRKGHRRDFNQEKDKQKRRESAYFWEERNVWFSDVWFDLIGTQQSLINGGQRTRSGAFPFELPYRLINMFSIMGDCVLDPFAGTGTTMQAAMCCQRHSISVENDTNLRSAILEKVAAVPELSRKIVGSRINNHIAFVRERGQAKGNLKYRNRNYGFPVMTRQEEDLLIPKALDVQYLSEERIKVGYSAAKEDLEVLMDDGLAMEIAPPSPKYIKKRQLKMF